MLSEAESRAYAAATWLYETQWQVASSATEAAAQGSISDDVRLRKGHAAPQWTISSGSELEAVSRAQSKTGSSSACAVAAVAELVRVLQQQSQTAVLSLVTISTVDAVPAALGVTAHSIRAPAKVAAQAGAAFGGAVRTAVLENSRLRTAVHDAAVEECRAWAAMYQQEQAAAASRAGAVHLPT